ncbi:MAG: replication initiator protein A [Armatimonadetes bacterium]|nr:replication initiator protein A [Armatimonadota bacterium]
MARDKRGKNKGGDTSRAVPLRIGRDEMNLAEFPFALLADRHPDGVDTIVFTDTVRGKEGEVERVWTVTGSEEFGLPLASDELVYVALMEVTKEQGFESRTIYITRYDLIKRLGWPDKGGSYRRLQAALDRLLGVTIKAERALWDNRKQRYVDVGFHIIDDYAIYDEQPGRKSRAGKKRLPYSYVAWNQVVFESFRAGYIKHLDAAFFFGLRSALSRRLYRYLDKKRYDGKPVFRIGLRKLAFEKLGMSRNYYPSHIKQELARAHRELTEKGFLREVRYQARPGDQDDLVEYRFTSRRYMVKREAKKPDELDDLAQELVAAGVTPAVAAELVAEHGEEARVQLKYLPFRAPRDPAAMLVEAIRGRWEPPASYLQARKENLAQQAEQEAQQQRLQEARRKHLAEVIEQQAADAVFSELPRRARDKLKRTAEEEVAASSPVLAANPGTRAYVALVQDKVRRMVMSEYPADFNAHREDLWAQADGIDDDL